MISFDNAQDIDTAAACGCFIGLKTDLGSIELFQRIDV